MTAKLFYVSGKPSAFSSLAKLQAAIKQSKGKFSTRDTEECLERQDAYTLHKPASKHFPRYPYTVTNGMEVLESNLLEVQKSVNTTIITSTY
jgi:hypothetical protein